MGQQIKLLYDLFKINSDAFYNDLLRLDFAVWVFALTGFVSFIIVILYYYVIDRPKTAKLSVWLIFLFLNAIILAVVGYTVANNTIVDDYLSAGLPVPDYSQDLIYFSAMNFLIAALFFLLFSILLKWKSQNSSHVPF